MVRSFYTDTAIRLRAPLVASGRGEKRDWVNSAPHELTGLRAQEQSSTDAGGRAMIQLRLMGPLDIDLEAADRVVWQGRTFEVDGEPLRLRGATGAAAHSETILRRVA